MLQTLTTTYDHTARVQPKARMRGAPISYVVSLKCHSNAPNRMLAFILTTHDTFILTAGAATMNSMGNNYKCVGNWFPVCSYFTIKPFMSQNLYHSFLSIANTFTFDSFHFYFQYTDIHVVQSNIALPWFMEGLWMTGPVIIDAVTGHGNLEE